MYLLAHGFNILGVESVFWIYFGYISSDGSQFMRSFAPQSVEYGSQFLSNLYLRFVQLCRCFVSFSSLVPWYSACVQITDRLLGSISRWWWCMSCRRQGVRIHFNCISLTHSLLKTRTSHSHFDAFIYIAFTLTPTWTSFRWIQDFSMLVFKFNA